MYKQQDSVTHTASENSSSSHQPAVAAALHRQYERSVKAMTSWFGSRLDSHIARYLAGRSLVLLYSPQKNDGRQALHQQSRNFCVFSVMRHHVQAQSTQQAKNATLTVTGAVSWRRPGLKYSKNEVFLDIVEEVNLLMSSTGTHDDVWICECW
jgi:hypothetical protein